MNYMMVDTGGQPGGGINIVDTMKPSGTVLYVEVEDIEAKLAKASQLGGKVIAPKTAIPGIGFFGMFEDPDGNTMGVFTGK